MVFDLHAQGGTFTERVEAMRHLATTPYLKVIEQFRANSNKALMEKLDDLVRHCGEGWFCTDKMRFITAVAVMNCLN
jgi:hypothetical protein